MGALLSIFADFVSIVHLLLDPVYQFRKAYARAALDPGLPVPSPTYPRWMRDPPHPDLQERQSDKLPSKVDVAIIGSGISGAAAAYSLLQSDNEAKFSKIAVFEARELCSGATARNGGHIKASAWDCYTRIMKHLGPERAAVLTRFQRKHLDVLVGLCKDLGLDAAEAREVETVDLFLDRESFEKAVMKVDETTKALPEEEYKIWDRLQAQEQFGTGRSVYGALSYKAGAIWAYRFVTSIWDYLMKKFPDVLSIETYTPVNKIAVDDLQAPKGYPYAVQTPRGTVYARQIVHATNAYASHLIPGLRRKITPLRAHMSAQKPGNQFPPEYNANRSVSVIYGDGFDYITQLRPEEDGAPPNQGDLMIGGGFARTVKDGVDMVGVSDDAEPLEGLTVAHISGVFPAVFSPNWGVGGGLKEAWSGILGFTGDLMPLVGRLDTKVTGRVPSNDTEPKTGGMPASEWIMAGFSGEGMVWSWLCGMALGLKMTGHDYDEELTFPGRPNGRVGDWFPDELWVSEKRLKSADASNLPSQM